MYACSPGGQPGGQLQILKPMGTLG